MLTQDDVRNLEVREFDPRPRHYKRGDGMIETGEAKVDGKKVKCLKVELPGAPLILLAAPRGYVMCNYLNLETAEKLGQAAAIVERVRSFDDVLNAKIVSATAKAKELGVTEGMLGRDALGKMG